MNHRFLPLFYALLSLAPASAGEKLPNGIELPDVWPPVNKKLSTDPMPVPYLRNPSAVVTIDLGRQLFVDDFLIAETDLKRTFHQPKYHADSPVLKPEKEWEFDKEEGNAAPFSDGVWYDAKQKKFLMWYQAAKRVTCLAVSDDGFKWTRPEFDVEPGTNIVLRTVRDSTTVWLDENADPKERFKFFEARYKQKAWEQVLHTSPDGIHWSGELVVSGPSWDRTTAFYNPFRKVWVASVRGHDHVKPVPVHRLRCYHEGVTAAAALGWKQHCDQVAKGDLLPNDLVPWIAADRLEPRHPDKRFADLEPQLYNLDAFPYESLMVGLFTIWQGPSNEVCKELGIHKRNEVLVGFSRDGFHWDRLNRDRFLPVSEDPKRWNAGNVQSAGGGCLVVGDELWFYCSGRTMHPKSTMSTGLATLRRDGFASLDAPKGGGTLTTRPVSFSGRHLFVNAAPGKGSLRAEVIDANGKVLKGFGRDQCKAITGDSTMQKVEWMGDKDLSSLANQPVKFRFVLTEGSLWSFWVTDDPAGASSGFVAAGGPRYTGGRDLRGK